MKTLSPINGAEYIANSGANGDGNTEYRIVPGSTNYLGHPPLYYHIMRLAGALRLTASM
jgi:hypothetical protein